MSDCIKAEGKAQPAPMYSLQADMAITYHSIPYTMLSDKSLNPHAEGLHDRSLAEELGPKEGAEPDRALLEHQHGRRYAPGCCRRYSCCFPLVIVFLVWIMMESAESFEHCPNCISSKPIYSCELQPRADYFCKTDTFQVCCYFDEDECREMDYPSELRYSMGQDFNLSMRIVMIICLIPLIIPCGAPYMIFKDCRHASHSVYRQRAFDVLCIVCFIAASLGCSRVVIKYYEFPHDRCSANSELFGISMSEENELIYSYSNLWIMSQTTYSSFFGFMTLCSFSILGSIILVLQVAINREKKAGEMLNDQNE